MVWQPAGHVIVSESTHVRVIGLLLAVGLSVPLITARALTPSPTGSGTHRQLGLPPCSMQLLWGIRCPACGMTTSWSYFTRGRWVRSFLANSGGFALAILAVGVVGAGAMSVRTGRWPSPGVVRYWSIAVVAAGAITIGDWLIRLYVGWDA